MLILLRDLPMATLIRSTETPSRHFPLSVLGLSSLMGEIRNEIFSHCPVAQTFLLSISEHALSTLAFKQPIHPRSPPLTPSHLASCSSSPIPPHTLPFALSLHFLSWLCFCPLFYPVPELFDSWWSQSRG